MMATTFGQLDFHTSFKPSSAFPLDAREYFESYAAALAAAKTATEAGSADSNFYFGQVLRVVDSGVASLYQIQPDATLSPVGGGAALDGVNQRVSALEETVGGIDDQIAAAVAAANHLSFKIVSSKEEIDPSAQNAANFIYLVPKADAVDDVYDEFMVVSGALEPIGSTKVDLSDYAKTADVNDALAGKVSVIDGHRLISGEEAQKLTALLGINAVSSEFSLDEAGQLSVSSVPMSKVAGLSAALENKVDAEDGARLIKDEEIKKLAGLVLKEDGTVESSSKVNADSVIGLAELLKNKVDAEEGKGLSANDLTDELLEKLNGIEPGAQKNVIEQISVGGTVLSVQEKQVDVPVATAAAFGVVKGSEGENAVSVAADGTMTLNSLNVNRLVQTPDTWIVMNGGDSSH